MDGSNFFRFVFENVGRPERTIDARSQIFKLRGQSAVYDVNTTQKCIPAVRSLSHEAMLPPASRN
jgi:hypothetical protein